MLLTSKEPASWGSGVTGTCGTDRHRTDSPQVWTEAEASLAQPRWGFCPRLWKLPETQTASAPGALYSRRGPATRSRFITKVPLMGINVKNEEDLNGRGCDVRRSRRCRRQVTGDRRSQSCSQGGMFCAENSQGANAWGRHEPGGWKNPGKVSVSWRPSKGQEWGRGGGPRGQGPAFSRHPLGPWTVSN